MRIREVARTSRPVALGAECLAEATGERRDKESWLRTEEEMAGREEEEVLRSMDWSACWSEGRAAGEEVVEEALSTELEEPPRLKNDMLMQARACACVRVCVCARACVFVCGEREGRGMEKDNISISQNPNTINVVANEQPPPRERQQQQLTGVLR